MRTKEEAEAFGNFLKPPLSFAVLYSDTAVIRYFNIPHIIKSCLNYCKTAISLL